MRLLLAAASAALCGCGAAMLAELSFSVCPVTRTAGGLDVDDGGVDVVAIIGGSRPRQIAAGHYPGWCRSAPGPLPALECGDPHVDIRYFLSWSRPAPGSLAVTRREVPDDDRQPATTETLATVSIAPEARAIAGQRRACPD
jgi:hypothetical protein